MSAPPVPHHRSNYSDSMWNTYITEAIQSGNHKQYCKAHNINYKTFNRKYTEYKQSNDKKNNINVFNLPDNTDPIRVKVESYYALVMA